MEKINNKLEIAKKIIRENIDEASCGIFNCHSMMPDPMTILYYDGQLRIDICYYYEYFEVFGLSEKEFEELEKYYNNL